MKVQALHRSLETTVLQMTVTFWAFGSDCLINDVFAIAHIIPPRMTKNKIGSQEME
jgi:hypothetical protein